MAVFASISLSLYPDLRSNANIAAAAHSSYLEWPIGASASKRASVEDNASATL